MTGLLRQFATTPMLIKKTGVVLVAEPMRFGSLKSLTATQHKTAAAKSGVGQSVHVAGDKA